jgi:hypothetical protein
MPHVKVLHPFSSEENVLPSSPVVQRLAQLLSRFAPFTVKLDAFDCFEQQYGCTLVLRATSQVLPSVWVALLFWLHHLSSSS